MKTQLPALLLLLISLAFPALADDAKDAEPLPEEDTILGTWHVQVMEGELVPADEEVRIIFNKDGTVKVFEGDREEEAGGYLHDKQRAEIKIFEDNDPTDIEVLIKYSFVDDMLVMQVTEDPGRRGEDRTQAVELTRNPEGTERHQKLRKARGDKPSVKQQIQRVRHLHLAALTYSVDMGKTPASIGDTVVGGYLTLEAALPASTQKELPEGFKDWKKQAKADWINQHLGYVYLQPANFDEIDANQLVVFELPIEEDQKIALAFADGSAQLMDFELAEKQVVKATGQTIAQWKKSKSPGSGAVSAADEQDQDKAPVE